MTEKVATKSDIEPSVKRKDGEPKKPYEPPRLVSQQLMEAVAAACVPVPPGKAIDGCPIQTS